MAVLDFLHSEPSLSAQLCSQLGMPLSAINSVHSEPLLFSQSHTHVEPASLASGMPCAASVLAVLDVVHTALSLSMRSLAQSKIVSSVLDSTHLETLLVLRSSGHLRSAVPPPGSACSGSVSPLSVLDPTHLDSLMLMRSRAQSNAPLFVIDLLHSRALLAARLFACLNVAIPAFSISQIGPLLSLLDLLHLDLSTASQLLARSGSAILLSGLAWIRSVSSPPVPDTASSDIALLSHSTGRLDLSSAALDLLHLDSTSAARSSARSRPAMFLPGLSRLGFVFSLPVPDSTYLRMLLSPKSSTRAEAVAVALDLAHSNVSLVLRSSSKFDSTVLLFGLSCLGSVFSLLVLDRVHFGFPSILQSLSCSNSSMFLPGYQQMEFPLLIQSLSRMESVTTMPDYAHVDTILPSRGFGQLGSALAMLDVVCMDLTLSFRSVSRSELVTFVPDFAHPKSAAILHSSSYAGTALVALDSTQLGMSALLQVLTRLGSVFLISGLVKTKSSSFLLEFMQCEFLVPLKSFLQMNVSLSALDLLHLDSMLFARSFG